MSCAKPWTARALEQYQGAIFDLDGTLADSMGVWAGLCSEWLRRQGRNPVPDIEKAIYTMTLAQSAEYVSREYGIALEPPAIISEWQNMAFERYRHDVAPKQGTLEAARAFQEAGKPIGILTSSFPQCCEAFLDRYKLRPLFSSIIYTHIYPGDKSAAGIWLSAAEKLGLRPASSLVFEDSLFAIKGAKAAGMDAAAVYDKSNQTWEETLAAADWYLRCDTE